MLGVGDLAPAFKLPSDAGRDVALKDFAGRTVVVYFYPRDDTPGCTVEAKDFTAAIGAFEKAGVAVLGVSKDTVQSHCRFRDKYGLKFPLLSDPELTVHKAFGAYGEKTMYGKKVEGVIRSTFVIGPDGKISAAFPSVKVAGHVQKVLERVGGAPATEAPKSESAAKKSGSTRSAATKKPAAKKPAAKKPAAKKPAAKKTTR